MTRRIIKVANPGEWEATNDCRNSEYGASVPCYISRKVATEEKGIYYPRYDVGDILYVRETWTPYCINKKTCRNALLAHSNYCYKASPEECVDDLRCKWHPSIHMPKEAARIWLEVTDVRVERLQEITIDDAISEGCFANFDPPDGHGFRSEARNLFRELWDSLNDKRGYGWDVNPWVWVIEFNKGTWTASQTPPI
jgi:hypothetical protein